MEKRQLRTALKRTRERRAEGPVCGVDEVGRGPLAGPVVAAAVILPRRMARDLAGAIDDSKKLTAAIRESLAAEIAAVAHVGIGLCSVEEIDAINILRASLLAMRRAVDALPHPPCFALVDGNQKPPLDIPFELVIGGDGIELSIAAASIVAKVHRDAIMQRLHHEHPHYGWHSNAGYATAAHCRALSQHGPTSHHRRSFAPIRQAELDFDAA
jgi:ribonuclease HII